MSSLHYIIRNYRPDDLNNYFRLYSESIKLGLTEWYASPQILSEKLRRPSYSPEQDLFIAEIAREIIGSINVIPELIISRAILECLVHREYWGRGLTEELFSYAIRRAGELQVKVAQICISQDNISVKNLLPNLGFRLVRRFLELKLEFSEIQLPNINDSTLSLSHLLSGEEDKLSQLQNRCFEGSWGYNPNTLKEIIYHIKAADSSLEDIILASRSGKYMGYCWTQVDTEEDMAAGGSKGRIYMIGVEPNYRGEKIGRKLLLAGLSHLKNKSIKVVELTVDSENKTACNLYHSIGFKTRTTSLWYEKSLG